MNAQLYLTILIVVSFVTLVVSVVITYRVKTKEYKHKIKLDISVDQMLLSENRISEFLSENKLKSDASIRDIAKALNVVEGGIENEINGRARLNDPDIEGKMLVVFKNDSSVEERLFDFAHECGHRINKDPTPATRPEGYNKPEIEQLADYVGAALLMPIDSVYRYVSEHNYENSSRREKMKLIQNLCTRYSVSRIIAIRRVKEVYAVKRAQGKGNNIV